MLEVKTMAPGTDQILLEVSGKYPPPHEFLEMLDTSCLWYFYTEILCTAYLEIDIE